MKIKELDKNINKVWDEFVYHHPDSSFYHLLGWKNVFEKVFNYKSFYLIAHKDSGEIEGILPLFLMRDVLGRKYLVSNPFANYAGVCAKSDEAERSLISHAMKLAMRERANYMELRHLTSEKKTDWPDKRSFVNFFLEINPDLEINWQNISSRNRGKVRKAGKRGVEVDIGRNYLPEFYRIFTQNLKYLGTPPFSIQFFESLLQEFPDNTDIFVLKLNSKIISAMFMFKFKDLIAEPWVASLREYNRIYVNNFLYWEAIKYAHQNNFKIFDFGRSTNGCGTYHFKRQWQAKPIQLYYEYFLNRTKTVPAVDAHDNKYQFYVNMWKRLPLSITKFIGPKIVKYLPEL